MLTPSDAGDNNESMVYVPICKKLLNRFSNFLL